MNASATGGCRKTSGQAWRFVAAVLLLSFGVAVLGLSEEPSSSTREFHFTYAAQITGLPPDAREVRIWVPLAKTRDNQRIRSRQIRATHRYEVHEEAQFGNDILYLRLTRPVPRQVDVVVEYEASVHSGRRIRPDPRLAGSGTVASTEELDVALRNEPLLVLNDTVSRFAEEATAGRTGDLEKARAIYDYVIRQMSYDKTTPGWGRGDTMRACLLKRGNCTDFHSLFISMARAVRIPARFVIGATIPEAEEGAIPGYHCWAEFYVEEIGWIPVDASEAWKHPDLREYYFGALDPNKFLINVGRNIRLVPPQSGPPVNIFFDPYVEVDGHTMGASVETRFQFRSHHEKEVST